MKSRKTKLYSPRLRVCLSLIAPFPRKKWTEYLPSEIKSGNNFYSISGLNSIRRWEHREWLVSPPGAFIHSWSIITSHNEEEQGKQIYEPLKRTHSWRGSNTLSSLFLIESRFISRISGSLVISFDTLDFRFLLRKSIF